MNVKKQTEYRQHRTKKLKKTAAAAVFTLVIGASIPIQAGIRYLVKERMEDIPKQEIESVNQMLQSQDNVEADGFSREYSEEESIRMQELEKAYQNGKFPEQTITFADSSKQIPEDSLCYAADTGTFYLPERTLTDEELLQIIDFNYTADYALSNSVDAQEAQKAWELEEERLKATVQAEGGITSQEAQKAAEMYLETEFGLSAEGMKSDVYLDDKTDGVPTYHVSYDIQDDNYFYAYGIDLSAKDGSLVNTSFASLPKDRTLVTGPVLP